jgi:hypothetical protein
MHTLHTSHIHNRFFFVNSHTHTYTPYHTQVPHEPAVTHTYIRTHSHAHTCTQIVTQFHHYGLFLYMQIHTYHTHVPPHPTYTTHTHTHTHTRRHTLKYIYERWSEHAYIHIAHVWSICALACLCVRYSWVHEVLFIYAS